MEGLGGFAKACKKKQQTNNGRRTRVDEARLRFINEGFLKEKFSFQNKGIQAGMEGVCLGENDLIEDLQPVGRSFPCLRGMP